MLTIYKVDDNEHVKVLSEEGSDNRSSVFVREEPFVKSLLEAEKVTVRIHTYDGETFTATFKVDELADNIGLLLCFSGN